MVHAWLHLYSFGTKHIEMEKTKSNNTRDVCHGQREPAKNDKTDIQYALESLQQYIDAAKMHEQHNDMNIADLQKQINNMKIFEATVAPLLQRDMPQYRKLPSVRYKGILDNILMAQYTAIISNPIRKPSAQTKSSIATINNTSEQPQKDRSHNTRKASKRTAIQTLSRETGKKQYIDNISQRR